MPATPGDPLDIRAADWNDVLAMLRQWRERGKSLAGNGVGSPLPVGMVWIKNASASNLGFGEVLGIDQPLFDFATVASEKYNGVRLKGVTPSTSTPHYGQYAILQAPAKANDGFAPAVIAGQAWVKLNITHAADLYCEIANGASTYLTTGALGSSRVLWKSSGTGSTDKWGLIRVGEPSGEILVKNDTGSPIAAANSGTATVYTGTPGSEASTGQTLTVFNRTSVSWASTKFGSAAILQKGNAYVSPQQT